MPDVPNPQEQDAVRASSRTRKIMLVSFRIFSMSPFVYCWRHGVNNYLAFTKIYFSFQDVLRDLTSLQPLTAPPSLLPRPSFVRPLTPSLAASVVPMTSNSVISSTIAYSTSSTAVI